MQKIIRNTLLSFEKLYTTLQIEVCLNSQPLTSISNDHINLEALTTSHFIIEEAMTALPERDK